MWKRSCINLKKETPPDSKRGFLFNAFYLEAQFASQVAQDIAT